MKHILEYKKFGYEIGDEILIHYWYSPHFITPVRIIEKVGRRFLISHNISDSEIQNAPDELISGTEIIDKYRNKNKNIQNEKEH